MKKLISPEISTSKPKLLRWCNACLFFYSKPELLLETALRVLEAVVVAPSCTHSNRSALALLLQHCVLHS